MDDRPIECPECRPRLRLSVRLLMVIVLLLGGGLGWVVHRVRVQSRGRRGDQEDTGRTAAEYDYSFLPPYSDDPPHQPGWRDWLVDRVGIDYFENAVSVTFYTRSETPDPAIHKEILVAAAKLRRLKNLELPDLQRVIQFGPGDPAGPEQPHHVNPGTTKARQPGLVHLKGLTDLESLDIGQLDPTDADLAPLGGLTTLTDLPSRARGSPTRAWPIWMH